MSTYCSSASWRSVTSLPLSIHSIPSSPRTVMAVMSVETTLRPAVVPLSCKNSAAAL